MALFTGMGRHDYSDDAMPKPSLGDGPWGEAITYWLNARGWRQADLLKAIRLRGYSTTKNTISTAARGFDCGTTTLRIIAAALDAPLEDVLVSPDRRSANEERERVVQAAVSKALRDWEAAGARGTSPIMSTAMDLMDQELERRKAAIRQTPTRKATHVTKSKIASRKK